MTINDTSVIDALGYNAAGQLILTIVDDDKGTPTDATVEAYDAKVKAYIDAYNDGTLMAMASDYGIDWTPSDGILINLLVWLEPHLDITARIVAWNEIACENPIRFGWHTLLQDAYECASRDDLMEFTELIMRAFVRQSFDGEPDFHAWAILIGNNWAGGFAIGDHQINSIPVPLMIVLRELKSRDYSPDTGTWLCIYFSVIGDQVIHSTDVDDIPDYVRPSITYEDLCTEFKQYPRPKLPDWVATYSE